MADHDYCVLDRVDDDVVLIEWDMAVGRDELRAFIDLAAAGRSMPLVAPYVLYESTSGAPHNRPVWAHRRFTHGDQHARFITEDDTATHLFGFGLVYLPRLLVKRWLYENHGHFNDSSFSSWHYRHGDEPEVQIAWGVRPVHLHYDISKIAKGLK